MSLLHVGSLKKIIGVFGLREKNASIFEMLNFDAKEIMETSQIF